MMKEFGESESERARERGRERKGCARTEGRGERKRNNLALKLHNGAMRNKDKEQKEHIKGNPRCYMERTRRHRQRASKQY